MKRSRDELAQLQKLIRKRCKRLRRDALELGRRFYAEPSKAFAKRISIFAGKRRYDSVTRLIRGRTVQDI